MSFDLVLDEPVERDTVEEHEGLLFMVDNKLYDRYKSFTIALHRYGSQSRLTIKPDTEAPDNGGGCGSCCG